MSNRRRYKNPPIEEALCEFRFKPSQEWDLTIPGKLHVQLSDQYPGKPRQQIKVELDPPFTEPGAPSEFRIRQNLRVQLLSENERRIVGIGKDSLSVHMLNPYQDPQCPDKSGWDEFYPRIQSTLNAYWDIASPVGVERIGVRYINKIIIPSGEIEPRHYIICAPHDIKGLPKARTHFLGRLEYRYDDETRAIVTYAKAEASDTHPALLLDIDVIWDTENAIDKEKALQKVKTLREKEREAFEALITDEARRLFDAC